MLTYIIVSLLIAIAPLASRSERVTNLIASLFALVQVASVALLFVFDRFDTALLTIFRADTLAVVFHVLMIAVLIFSLIHSSSYLRAEKVTTRSYNAYYTLLMLLALSITCVYYSYNLAMTWVFLELTTICSAGIIYHREFEQSLEATWKYIFVCSTGIAMAYLGILLLSTVAVEGTLDYAALKSVIAEGNPLYLKLAFLLIVIGRCQLCSPRPRLGIYLYGVGQCRLRVDYAYLHAICLFRSLRLGSQCADSYRYSVVGCGCYVPSPYE